MTTYLDAMQLAAWLNIEDGTDDERLDAACQAAQTGINLWLGRNFNSDTADTARYYHPLTPTVCPIDDCHTITSIATDNAEDGTYSTAWAAGDWQGTPIGGISKSGETGWPYTKIVAIESREFVRTIRPYVKVTGKWGWTAIPADIKLAARLYAAELFKLHESPFGTAWSAEGADAVIRANRPLRDLLTPYKTARSGGDTRFLVA